MAALRYSKPGEMTTLVDLGPCHGEWHPWRRLRTEAIRAVEHGSWPHLALRGFHPVPLSIEREANFR